MKISPQELLIVLAIVLIIFGPKQLPKLGKMFGKTMKSFKEGVDDTMSDDEGAKEKKAAAEKSEDDSAE